MGIPESTAIVVWHPGRDRDVARRLLIDETERSFGIAAVDIGISRMCPACGDSRHGRPAVTAPRGTATPFVSISYTSDLTVVALTAAGPVGIDVERSDSVSSGIDSVLGATARNRHARTTTWVRTESLLKATGHGLTLDPRRIRITNPDEPPRLLSWPSSEPEPPDPWMADLAIGTDHVAAISVLGVPEMDVTIRRAGSAVRPG